ncbi:LAMI_0H03620g1_1 [Lachancea mirantina]|uniref:ER membrane protein complex subunit 2 n=1 Tax=Lachancea mirantina TaxID=1230905 RepID=A0A1G4KEB4_9SACH|nr:LAMI_0H03620g1_1 [Lachancea mirantina]
MEALRKRFLTIYETKFFSIAPPNEIVELYNELKAYLKVVDPALSQTDYMSLMHMLFDLCIYNGKDIEAQVIYKTLEDRFGDNSPYLHVMQATMMQVNENDVTAEKYLQELLDRVLEYDTDILDYLLVSKKLLSIRKRSLSREKYISELLNLSEKFPLDGETWTALATEYLEAGQLDRAAFCLEEVLCIAPFNYICFAQLGEVLYYKALRDKKGKKDVLQDSLNNFLRSVELSETYLKGWAFVAKITGILDGKKALHSLAKKKLEEINQNSDSHDHMIAKIILDKL